MRRSLGHFTETWMDETSSMASAAARAEISGNQESHSASRSGGRAVSENDGTIEIGTGRRKPGSGEPSAASGLAVGDHNRAMFHVCLCEAERPPGSLKEWQSNSSMRRPNHVVDRVLWIVSLVSGGEGCTSYLAEC